jgi:hypothetical protein
LGMMRRRPQPHPDHHLDRLAGIHFDASNLI